MPYVSDKQRKFFNVAENRAKLTAEGVDVDEWNQSSKGLKLPETAPKKRKKRALDGLLDMDRDDLLDKLAHMELRNRFVQRAKEALKLPDSMSGAMSALGGAGGAVDPSLLSRAIPNLTGAAGGAVAPSLLSKLKTMAQPYADPALKWLNENPTAALGLGGAAGGAALGGLSSLAGPRKKKRVLSSMLTGGLAGGALGLGGGAVAKGLGLGDTFGAMKDNFTQALKPETIVQPEGAVQQGLAEAPDAATVDRIMENTKPVNNPLAATGGILKDTAGAVGDTATGAMDSHPLSTSLGIAHVGTGLKKEWERKQIARGDVAVGHGPGAFPLNDSRYGVSVNAVDDTLRGLDAALKGKEPLKELRRFFPDTSIPDAQLPEVATRMAEKLRETRLQRDQLGPAGAGPALKRHATGAEQFEHAFRDPIQIELPEGATPAPSPAGPAPGPTHSPILDAHGRPIPGPPPTPATPQPRQPRYVTVTPHMQQNAGAGIASKAAPRLAYDFLGDLAKYAPRTNNALRHGAKYVPLVGAGLAGLAEHQRIAAENAARQGQ